MRSEMLLYDVQQSLAHALKSLEGKEPEGLYDGYIVFTGAYVNRAVAGL